MAGLCCTWVVVLRRASESSHFYINLCIRIKKRKKEKIINSVSNVSSLGTFSGILTGSMGQGCSFKSFSFGIPWDPAFLECCREVAPSSTTDLTSEPSTSESTETDFDASSPSSPSSSPLPSSTSPSSSPSPSSSSSSSPSSSDSSSPTSPSSPSSSDSSSPIPSSSSPSSSSDSSFSASSSSSSSGSTPYSLPTPGNFAINP